ncbi:MAG: hypothetical protein ACI9FB_004505 [Candidatus Azotimanducaceae bacterium]|jgi:hypothetical protein
MGQKILLTIFGLVLLALGLWGQYEISPSRLQDNFTTSLYEILMLFLLAGEWTLELEKIPVQIEITRFVAPLATLTSLILAFASATRISISNYRVRLFSNHIVVVGLGDKSWQFLQTCRASDDIVLVERNPENLLIGQARARGINTIVGDIFDESMFKRLNLRLASELIAFTGNDGANVELAIKARTYIRKNNQGGRHLKIHIHLKEIGLAHHLEGYPKFFADYSTTEMSFFSVYDLSARLLLRDYPPEIFADVAGQERVHLALYGYNRLTEKLIIEAALTCQYSNNSRLRVTVFDDDAENRSFRLKAELPHLSKICDVEFIQQTIIGPHIFIGHLSDILPSITLHVICMEPDEGSLGAALMLRSALLEKRSSNAPIMVRMQQSSGLAQLLESNVGGAEIPDGLYPFGMLDQVLHVDNVLSMHLDKLARSFHEMYLASQSKGDTQGHTALQVWGELPEWERKQNLLQADHWPIKLRAIQCRQSDDPCPVPDLSFEEAQSQAAMEHNRYVNTKYFDGWEFGEQRIEEAKVNPFLMSWQGLSDAQREQEIDEVLKQPAHLAEEARIFLQRTVTIGVTGHRLHRMDINDKEIHKRVVSALERLAEQYPHHHFIILSPLAEGADRLVAKLAMQTLNASLRVPLPLPYDLYVTDFGGKASVEEFKTMVGKAELYYEMPMKFGNMRELAMTDKNGQNSSRNKQYALVGAYIAQRSDELIALWDGKPDEGIGGPAQVIRWFDSGEIEETFDYSASYFKLPSRSKSIIIDV